MGRSKAGMQAKDPVKLLQQIVGKRDDAFVLW
jgi:hypothetical protein